jgi:hypothetical protein
MTPRQARWFFGTDKPAAQKRPLSRGKRVLRAAAYGAGGVALGGATVYAASKGHLGKTVRGHALAANMLGAEAIGIDRLTAGFAKVDKVAAKASRSYRLGVTRKLETMWNPFRTYENPQFRGTPIKDPHGLRNKMRHVKEDEAEALATQFAQQRAQSRPGMMSGGFAHHTRSGTLRGATERMFRPESKDAAEEAGRRAESLKSITMPSRPQWKVTDYTNRIKEAFRKSVDDAVAKVRPPKGHWELPKNKKPNVPGLPIKPRPGKPKPRGKKR